MLQEVIGEQIFIHLPFHTRITFDIELHAWSTVAEHAIKAVAQRAFDGAENVILSRTEENVIGDRVAKNEIAEIAFIQKTAQLVALHPLKSAAVGLTCGIAGDRQRRWVVAVLEQNLIEGLARSKDLADFGSTLHGFKVWIA